MSTQIPSDLDSLSASAPLVLQSLAHKIKGAHFTPFDLATLHGLPTSLFVNGQTCRVPGEPFNRIFNGTNWLTVELGDGGRVVLAANTNQVHSVTAAPLNTAGIDNDYAWFATQKTLYRKASGVWAEVSVTTDFRVVTDLTELATLTAQGVANTAVPPLQTNEPVRVLSDIDAEYRWDGTSAFTRVALGFDTEGLQDAVATMFDGAHTNATITYNDTTGKLTISATGGGGTNYLTQIPQASGDSYLINDTDNSIDATVVGALIMAPGRSTEPNFIGTTTAKPTGTDFNNSASWGLDTAYPAGTANVAGILSGYDHIVNQIAGVICGGGHNYIQYNVEGHSFIGGGSYNWIGANAGRTTIVSGRNNKASGASAFTFGFIGSGIDNNVGATFASVVNGARNNVTGSLSIVLNGNDNTCNHSRVAMLGDWGFSAGDRTFNLSADRFVEAGDMQSVRQVQGCRTTDVTATVTSAATTGSRFLVVPAGKFASWVVRVMLVAKRDGSADANNDANYASAAWSGEFLVEWNGSAYIASALTQVGPAASVNTALTVIRDNIGITTTPVLLFSSSSLRCQVVGLATTRINWVASFDAVQTLVS